MPMTDPSCCVSLVRPVPCTPQIGVWDKFNVFDAAKASNGRPLTAVVMTVLEQLGLFTHFSIDRQKMLVFLRELELNYRSNAYHNSTHAADVVQALYILLKMVSDCCAAVGWHY